MRKEFYSVAKAKGCTEIEIWIMGMLEYYKALAVLESYNSDLEKMQKDAAKG